jgi:hypothetical protein
MAEGFQIWILGTDQVFGNGPQEAPHQAIAGHLRNVDKMVADHFTEAHQGGLEAESLFPAEIECLGHQGVGLQTFQGLFLKSQAGRLSRSLRDSQLCQGLA